MQAKPKTKAAVNLTVRNVPPSVALALKQRAARNHRSLQGELLAILERAAARPEPLSVDEAFERIRALGLKTPSESAAIVRELRDSR